MKFLFQKGSSLLLLFCWTSPALAQNIDDLFNSEQAKDQEAIENERNTKTEKKHPSGEPAQFQFNDSAGRTYSLDMMAAVDTVLEWDKNTPHSTGNKYYVRTGEFGFYAAIDHLAEGVLTFAAHDEGGELMAEVHEAYLQMPGTLIPRTTIRLGKMFPQAGRLNGIHQHDWSFVTPPVVHEKLLDYEGILDTGAEFSFLMPWPFWQELTIGAFNGRTFGHAHDDGEQKNNPLFNGRLKQFFPLGDRWGTQFGFSYLRWHPETVSTKVSHQYGFDFLLKYKRGKLASFQWQTEAWYRETRMKNERKLDPPADPVETHAGTYTFLEWQPLEQWAFGARYDYYTIPTLRESNQYTGLDQAKKNGLEEVSMIVTFRPSEFSFFRGQASTRVDFETGLRTWQYYLQATFILGKHPAHVY